MFFKQIRRNAARNRKGDGLFFSSLVIAIVAFYTLLSLGRQDVLQFLQTLESDGVARLLKIIPVIYVFSLFFVFFLVYFACRYRAETRRKEFGLYLMLGMKRSRLFAMLVGETFWNSWISLLIGLPLAVLLTEGISMATARAIGLSLIGRRFSFSLPAVRWTIVGYLIVQLLALLLIALPYGKKEPAELLRSDVAAQQQVIYTPKAAVYFISGLVLLLSVFYLGIFELQKADLMFAGLFFLALAACGTIAIFFLYKGLGGFLGRRIAAGADTAAGLSTFTRRQVQETVLSKHKSLAVSALLLIIALACFSYGIGVGISRATEVRGPDVTIMGEESTIEARLEHPELKEMIASEYPLFVSRIRSDQVVSIEEMKEALRTLPEQSAAHLADHSLHLEHLISESSYNHLLEALGEPALDLQAGEAAWYCSIGEHDMDHWYAAVLPRGLTCSIGEQTFRLRPRLYTDKIVADRGINLMAALIVCDDVYEQLAAEPLPFCRNAHLKQTLVAEHGLMQCLQRVNDLLRPSDLHYESYLSGIGRNLFFKVAGSYLSIYLGVLFLLIANSVLGTKFLIQQRENRQRYRILLMLGADKQSLCASAGRQIRMYFHLVLGVALVCSIAVIYVLFANFTRLPFGTRPLQVILQVAAALFGFVLFEWIYIRIVTRLSRREIRSLDVTDRG